jgi:biotin carboxylase
MPHLADLPWLPFIESNTSGTGLLFVRAAKQNGFRPILLTMDPLRYQCLKEEALPILPVDTSDRRAILGVCKCLSEDGLAGIISTSEYYVVVAAAIARRFCLPGPRVGAVRICRDKWAARVALQQAAVGVPRFRQSGSVRGAVVAARDIGFPVVVKPPSESGSVGVRMCASEDDVSIHAHYLLGQRRNERGIRMRKRVMIEELVQGTEYSVETFGNEIIGITEKHLGSLPTFVEIGHDFPAVLSSDMEKEIYEVVVRARDVLGVNWGPSHFELRLSPQGPKIIEVNPRLAGGYIPRLVEISTGIDLIGDTIRLATGHFIRRRKAHHQFSCIRFLLAEHSGEVVNVDGISTALSIPGVVEAKVYRTQGDKIGMWGDYRDRIGHVISYGSDPTMAAAAADKGLSELRIGVARED